MPKSAAFPKRFGGKDRKEPATGCNVHHLEKRILWRLDMGRGLLLWLIGIPLPIILVIWLLGGLS